ncbi:MAG: hypothetical protein ACREMP_02515 [Candidatus Tyrphobacter sp.]
MSSLLRAVVILLGIVFIAGGAVVFHSGGEAWPVSIYLFVVGALILIGTIFERRYRPKLKSGGDWQATGERFVDPTTGKLTEVRYDPKTGERRYVEDAAPKS